MAITNEQIERINALAAKNKTAEGLTEAEQKERAELRQLYLDSVRASLRSQVESIKVVDEKGRDVTPDKLKKVQKEKGLRD